MFDEDDGPTDDNAPDRRYGRPEVAAADKLEELRMYAELAAVFEGTAKFGHALLRDLTPDLARRLQVGMVTLERARDGSVQLIPAEKVPLAHELLRLHREAGLSTCDYHSLVRPGEVHLARWVVGTDFDTVFSRLCAHFDAMLSGHVEDEQAARGWQGDPSLPAYIAALEKLKPDLTSRYLVPHVRRGTVPACLSTHTADELNIDYLASTVMQLSPRDLTAPSPPADGGHTDDTPWAEPDESAAADESELAWYFKMFLLRGHVDGGAAACFYAFLQKADHAV
ncbi:MAG: hypothetical protein ACK4PI_08610 [Tepidisphaerales bacterium]